MTNSMRSFHMKKKKKKKRAHSFDTTLLKYDCEHLISIGKQVKVDRRLKLLDFNVVKTIRNLRINH